MFATENLREAGRLLQAQKRPGGEFAIYDLRFTGLSQAPCRVRCRFVEASTVY